MNYGLTIAAPNLPAGDLDRYIQSAFSFPMVTEAEENELAIQIYENNDADAARRLIGAHLRFVIKVARGFTGYGLPLGDLIQEGNVGLVKAVKRFDPYVGVRLVTFAIHWIKAEITEYVLRNWRIVKVATTKAQRKLFFKLRGYKKGLGYLTQEEIETIAEELEVSVDTVKQMELRLLAKDSAFDPVGPEHEDDPHFAPAQFLRSSDEDPADTLAHDEWKAGREEILRQAMASLDLRAQEVLRARWLTDEKETLQDLAKRFHVSAERIRQIEKAAMDKLKKAMSTPA